MCKGENLGIFLAAVRQYIYMYVYLLGTFFDGGYYVDSEDQQGFSMLVYSRASAHIGCAGYDSEASLEVIEGEGTIFLLLV